MTKMALLYLSVQRPKPAQDLKTPGAAVLSLGRFGCSGQGFPRIRAKQGCHQTPMGEGGADTVEQLVFGLHGLPV